MLAEFTKRLTVFKNKDKQLAAGYRMFFLFKQIT